MKGKHSEEFLKIKELENVIKLRDKEIKDIKTYCAEQFEKIKDLCFINDYSDRNMKLRKIHEIASDNFSQLVTDMVIDETDDSNRAKIIELPNTRKSTK